MRDVTLSGCKHLSDDAVLSLAASPAEQLGCLQSVNFNGCGRVTCVGVSGLLRQCSSLVVLDLAGVHQVADAAFSFEGGATFFGIGRAFCLCLTVWGGSSGLLAQAPCLRFLSVRKTLHLFFCNAFRHSTFCFFCQLRSSGVAVE